MDYTILPANLYQLITEQKSVRSELNRPINLFLWCCQMKILSDEKHDQTFGIKCCRMKSMTRLLELSMTGLLELRHDWTFGIKCCQIKVLSDKKHDQTFGIKVREVLPDEKHDWTFGIKCCQMKSTTRLLELSVARRKT
ncbi:hypothetical protein RclHR1_12440006 [Rhizophagus clarus]|uniref:Uncharacterized protein n=1 Tax=Rhizophagus clarus TaxID=94130 RepID=A0A2Z6Q7A7_9GLOM|nr:hypothetical protein RclHR1_12440006 [Rhizophagus clarus]